MGKDKKGYGFEFASLSDLYVNGSYGVSKEYLESGIQLVPPQGKEGWTCGVNSAARFAAMLGQTIKHYDHFMKNAPKYTPFVLFGPHIGPNPGRLQDYLRKHLPGSDIGQRCTGNFGPQNEIIEKSLMLDRPVLALLADGNLMHWVNIVRYIPETDHYGILDTQQDFYKVKKDRFIFDMDCENCAADLFGFVEKYNTITCTNACNYRRFYERFFDARYYADSYADLKNAFGYEGWRLFQHFVDDGIKEGRSAKYNTSFRSYLLRYDDLKREFGEDYKRAAEHYRDCGEKEGRSILIN